jgi:hypothetical protein
MAKNLRAGLRQSIKASRKAGVTGAGIFSLAPLDLRFALQKTLDPRVTFTRASTGTYVGSDGLIKTATTDEARFDHNPTTGESLGLLVEEARTNLLLNSATLSTQSVTVAAAANTLSFYGTGTVTLTGVSTAGPLVGTGANNRVSLTFTPTAGVLVLTVSGSVTNAQLEAGAFATSYIPTTTATVTRAADVASITGSAFSSWYRQDEGTVFAGFGQYSLAAVAGIASIDDSTTSNRIQLRVNTLGAAASIVSSGGSIQANYSTSNTSQALQPHSAATSYKANDFSLCLNGGAISTDSAGSIPTVNQLVIGNNVGANPLNGTIRRLTYWPVRLANPTLQAITTP